MSGPLCSPDLMLTPLHTALFSYWAYQDTASFKFHLNSTFPQILLFFLFGEMLHTYDVFAFIV